MAEWTDCLLDPRLPLSWVHGILSRVPASFRASDRVIDDHIIWYSIDGGCDIIAAAGALSMRAGSLIWIPPRERMSFAIPARVRPMMTYSFRFRFGAPGQLVRFPHDGILRADAREVEPELRRLLDDLAVGDAHSPMRARLGLYFLYTSLARPPGATAGAGRLAPPERQALGRYARLHLGHRLAPSDLARELGMPLGRFIRLFKRTYGMPPRRWLLEQRIAEASFRLDHGHEPIGAIAEALGYADRHLFNRQFRAVTGRTPGAHRARAG